jgi:hypothetical protein
MASGRGVLLSGGPGHDFPALSSRLAELLAQVGVVTTITTDPEQVPSLIEGADLLVINALRWQMTVERYAPLRASLGYSPSPEFRSAVTEFVAKGGGLIGMHAASICFDDWLEWGHVLGARWDWDKSSHPTFGQNQIQVRPTSHAIVDGLPETFDTSDEIYGFLELEPDVEPLFLGSHSGAQHPLLWAREVGRGRVVHNALGHHLPSYEAPELQTVIRRSALWCLRADDSEVRAA